MHALTLAVSAPECARARSSGMRSMVVMCVQPCNRQRAAKTRNARHIVLSVAGARGVRAQSRAAKTAAACAIALLLPSHLMAANRAHMSTMLRTARNPHVRLIANCRLMAHGVFVPSRAVVVIKNGAVQLCIQQYMEALHAASSSKRRRATRFRVRSTAFWAVLVHGAHARTRAAAALLAANRSAYGLC